MSFKICWIFFNVQKDTKSPHSTFKKPINWYQLWLPWNSYYLQVFVISNNIWNHQIFSISIFKLCMKRFVIRKIATSQLVFWARIGELSSGKNELMARQLGARFFSLETPPIRPKTRAGSSESARKVTTSTKFFRNFVASPSSHETPKIA